MKKDIYWQGKIYVGVDQGASRYDYHNHEVSGSHNWVDGQDVTGLYELQYQIMETGGRVWWDVREHDYNVTTNDRRIVAIPLPSSIEDTIHKPAMRSHGNDLQSRQEEVSVKKDIFYSGRIYEGVEHSESFNGDPAPNIKSYEVIGKHNFKDGDNVTGGYKLKESWFSGVKSFKDNIVAIPSLPVSSGKSKEEIVIHLRDCYNRYIHLLSGELSKFRKLAKNIHSWAKENSLERKVRALDRLETELYQLSITPESAEIIKAREELANALEVYADQQARFVSAVSSGKSAELEITRDDLLEAKMIEVLDSLDVDSEGTIIGRYKAADECIEIAKQYAADQALPVQSDAATEQKPTGVSVDRELAGRCYDALHEIMFPVNYMQDRLKEGEKLDGINAITLANNGGYLRQIAANFINDYPDKEAFLNSLPLTTPVGSAKQCICQSCNNPYYYDLTIPDELWEKIAPKPVEGFKGGGLLCPECIVLKLSSLIK